jgi:hypothetical protein
MRSGPTRLGLPGDLESISPGLLLAVILSSVDRERLSGFDQVRLLPARSRMVSELNNDPEPDLQTIFFTTASEISAALTLTRRASELQTDLA